MEIVVFIIKYSFIVALSVQVALIGRSLFQLARDKAQAAQATPPAQE